jgi:hypothetical protein
MALPQDWEATFQSNALTAARMRCPHCEHASTFSVLFNNNVASPDPNVLILRAVLQCNYPQCRQLVYVITSKPAQHHVDQRRDSDSLTIFPKRRLDEIPESVPPPIAEDWIEAQKTFNEGAVKAAAVMCRRVLYGVLLDKKCKEHPLHEGIKELAAQARLPQVVEQWLAEIKDDGHDAAHPHRALDVPAENVAETMEYTKELLRFVYIEPDELQKRLKRKGVPVVAPGKA